VLKLLLLSLDYIGQFSTRRLSNGLSSVASDVPSKMCLYFISDLVVTHNRVYVYYHICLNHHQIKVTGRK